AEQVIRRAERQGYVLPGEVREELTQAGLPDSFWKDVLALARASLTYRRGKYYYTAPVSERVRPQPSQQRGINPAVQHLIAQHTSSSHSIERREANRVDFIQPVKVITETGQELTLLSRDLSASGIRLVGTRRLLGQKIRVVIPSPGGEPWDFQVRIL